MPYEGALWGRQTPKARSSSYGPFLESLRNSHAGLFDDSSSDPGHVPPLTAILDCSLLSFRPPLCWDLIAAKDRIQEGPKTCIWSIGAIQLLPCPQRECHTLNAALCTLPQPATLAWRIFSERGLALASVPHQLQGTRVKLSKGFSWSLFFIH